MMEKSLWGQPVPVQTVSTLASAVEFIDKRKLAFDAGKSGLMYVPEVLLGQLGAEEYSPYKQMELLLEFENGWLQYLLSHPDEVSFFEDLSEELIVLYKRLVPELIINPYLVKNDDVNEGCKTLVEAAKLAGCSVLELYTKAQVYRLTTMQVPLCL